MTMDRQCAKAIERFVGRPFKQSIAIQVVLRRPTAERTANPIETTAHIELDGTNARRAINIKDISELKLVHAHRIRQRALSKIRSGQIQDDVVLVRQTV